MDLEFWTDVFWGLVLVLLVGVLCFLLNSLFDDMERMNNRVQSHKEVVCNGVVVLSGNGIVYKDNGTYTLAGKTYQMKGGDIRVVNDSYVGGK